jgi:hypothetical protein
MLFPFLNLIQSQNLNNIDKSISYSLMKEIAKQFIIMNYSLNQILKAFKFYFQKS